MPPTDRLTVEELALELGVSRWTIIRWLEKGEIPGTKVGRRWFINRMDVAKLVPRRPSRSLGEPSVGRNENDEVQRTYPEYNSPIVRPSIVIPAPLSYEEARFIVELLEGIIRAGNSVPVDAEELQRKIMNP